jgi:protease IV
MKGKWAWVFVAIAAAMALMFVAVISVISFLIGDNRSLVAGSGIGLVEVKGMIIDPQATVKQLHDFMLDDAVKGVVVRIDSPGGIVGPSQEIHAEIKKLAAKKKVVVSMGSVAASGGYYIAVPATTIYANPGTITGSIGVLMKFSNVEGLMDRIGMKAFTLKTGKFKDVGSPLRTMSPEERAMLQGVIDSTHGQFVSAVAEGRKLPLETVRAIADGRIFTGEQAMNLRLIDRLGTMQDAIEEAGRLAAIKGEPRIIKPPKKRHPFLDVLIEETAAKVGNLVRQERGLSVSYEMDGASGQ